MSTLASLTGDGAHALRTAAVRCERAAAVAFAASTGIVDFHRVNVIWLRLSQTVGGPDLRATLQTVRTPLFHSAAASW